jgi:hypothetical protein
VTKTAWRLILKGGAFDGSYTFRFPPNVPEPGPVLIAWRCGGLACEGHWTFDPADEDVNLETCVAYRRVELEVDERRAVYELGDEQPGDGLEQEERELVGAGVERFFDG